MNPIYQGVLDGSKKSPAQRGAAVSPFVHNELPFAVSGFYVLSNGLHLPIGKILSHGVATLKACVGDYYFFTNPYSGAFICAMEITQSITNYSIVSAIDKSWSPSPDYQYLFLTNPNDIGPVPQPSSDILIPQNTPPVMVGCGTAGSAPASGNYVLREQNWCLLGDSYTVVGGESRTVNYTVTTGKQSVSSDQKEVAASIGLTTGGSWGPVSASLSASLNASASMFQEVTITEETQTYVSDVVTNNSNQAKIILRWQLVDRLSVYNKTSGAPVSTIVSNSIVIAQSHDLSTPPKPKQIAALVIPETRPLLEAIRTKSAQKTTRRKRSRS